MKKEELIRKLKFHKFPRKILDAFEKLNREDFVPRDLKKQAYEDKPLPIGAGQTISQPYTIAFMLNLLELRDKLKILEVGSGSGYALALINQISKNSEIYGIERIKKLAEKSRGILDKSITIIHGDGSKGLKEKAPFDRILVSASASDMPQKLVAQLKIGGVLVVPVRNSIIYLKKFRNKNKIIEYPGFLFVPLIEN